MLLLILIFYLVVNFLVGWDKFSGCKDWMIIICLLCRQIYNLFLIVCYWIICLLLVVGSFCGVIDKMFVLLIMVFVFWWKIVLFWLGMEIINLCLNLFFLWILVQCGIVLVILFNCCLILCWWGLDWVLFGGIFWV